MSTVPERDPRPITLTPITHGRGRPPLAFASIPIPPTALIGREGEIDAVTELIGRDDVRLVTLTGPGGVGKTRLAIAIALNVASDFADGVAYVELAALRDEALVGPAIAKALSIGGVESGQLVERLATHLHERELLLVLDNFEQVVEAAPLLSQLLRTCGGLKLLVTSRSALRISGEWNVAVPPLPLPEPEPELAYTPEALSGYAAIRLFVERARAAHASFTLTEENAPAIARISAAWTDCPWRSNWRRRESRSLPRLRSRNAWMRRCLSWSMARAICPIAIARFATPSHGALTCSAVTTPIFLSSSRCSAVVLRWEPPKRFAFPNDRRAGSSRESRRWSR